MNKSIITKAKALVFALTISGASFGQLNNCINTKEHPLIREIIDSIKTNPNYKSILAYTIIKSNQLGLARSTILSLAYAWASCKKISDHALRSEKEFKFISSILSDEEFARIISHIGMWQQVKTKNYILSHHF